MIAPTPSSFKPSSVTVLHYYPDFGAFGGIEQMLLALTTRMQSTTPITPVVACTQDGKLYRRLQAEGIRVVGIQSASLFKNPHLRLLDVSTMVQLKLVLDDVQPDMVHVHIGSLENRLFQSWGYPLIYTLHGYGSLYSLKDCTHPTKRLFKNRVLRPLFWLATRHADTVCVVSQAEKTRLEEENYLCRHAASCVAPNGVDKDALSQQASLLTKDAFQQTLSLPNNARCIGFINRLDANKNPLGFLKLADSLLARHPDWPLHFVMAGEGPLQQPLAEAIGQNGTSGLLSERVRLLGFYDNVPGLLSQLAAVVHIPDAEGFGLGVLEAMALGTPPVAWQAGGITDLLTAHEVCHLMASPGDWEGLLKILETLLTAKPEESIRLSRALQERAQAFGLAQTVQQYQQVYEQVLARKNPHKKGHQDD